MKNSVFSIIDLLYFISGILHYTHA